MILRSTVCLFAGLFLFAATSRAQNGTEAEVPVTYGTAEAASGRSESPAPDAAPRMNPRNMSEEERAAFRERLNNMSEEERAAFREQWRATRGAGGGGQGGTGGPRGGGPGGQMGGRSGGGARGGGAPAMGGGQQGGPSRGSGMSGGARGQRSDAGVLRAPSLPEKYQPLVTNSPFMSAEYRASLMNSMNAGRRELLFTGLSRPGGVWWFGLEERRQNRTYWMSEGESDNGIEIRQFDETARALTVSIDGREFILRFTNQ